MAYFEGGSAHVTDTSFHKKYVFYVVSGLLMYYIVIYNI